ncbi:MAG: chemotaxis protein CheA [Eubacteriales bacterium]|nr:chemotaxis protein CheA [Eubacteriales bacterium]
MNDNDSMIEVYVYENLQLLEQLEEMLLDNKKEMSLTRQQIDEVFRVMHTIKGSSAMMGYNGLTQLSHSVEDVFAILRQNPEVPKDEWQRIFDLVLECVDFFKTQIAMVQEGLLPDGDIEELHAGSVELLERLSALDVSDEPAPVTPAPAAFTPPAPTAPVAQPVQPRVVSEAPAPESAPAPEAESAGSHYYYARIIFQQGCAMESVRAFAIVNALGGMYSRIAHIPEDLNVNCDEAVIANGFKLYIETTLPEEQIKETLEDTIFLQSLELSELSDASAIPVPLKRGELPIAAESAPVKEPSARTENPEKDAAKAAQSAAAGAKLAPKPRENTANPAAAQNAKTSNFLSVKIGRVDKLMDLVGEIVTTESMVSRNPEVAALHIESFEKSTRRLRQLTDELQDVVMSIRMVPIMATFRKMQRIVYDMSRKVGKETELILLGEQTEVDKNVIEKLSDPLMHMIRNSMDHGLESPEERRQAGKPEIGTITLEARNVGSDVMIVVADDGRGLDRDAIIRKAIEKGLTTKPESAISDREAFSFITLPGFSTNDAVTEYSGRGVGMDVVCTNVEKMGGTLSIESEKGAGTTFTLHIPLTLAIIDGMEVHVGDEHYIIPILNIRESFESRLYDLIVDPNGDETIIIRGQCYRVLRLHKLFGVEKGISDFKQGIMVLVESEGNSACLFVDRLAGEQQVVIKPMPAFIARTISRRSYLSGCSIMGDGSISLILDVNSLTRDDYSA